MKTINIIYFLMFFFILADAQDLRELDKISFEAGISTEEAIRRAEEYGISEEELRKAIEGEAAKEEVKLEEGVGVEWDTLKLEEFEDTVEAVPPDTQAIMVFGLDIFNLAPQTFEPPDFGPVDPEYPIGPGDEILIRIWGEVEDFHSLIVDREGKIFIPNVGRTIVNGLTLEQVREKITTSMSSAYSGIKEKTTFVDISLGKLKKIKVFIVGEVVRPGGYTISSMSTVFNALYYAGGPTPKGSLRNVKVIRHNKVVAVVDLYEYLLAGKRENDVRLNNFDTILIPPVGKRVTLTGRIHRPAIYELKEEETLLDLMAIAGGLEADAYSERIQITRIIQDEMKEIIDVNLKEVLVSEDKEFVLGDGDEITVFSVLDRIENYVDLEGNVRRPGRFALVPSIKVKDLVEKGGGIYEDTYMHRAIIIRTHPDLTQSIIRFDLEEALAGNPQENRLLQRWDEVLVRSVWEVGAEKKKRVKIYGSVANPGAYDLYKGMTLKDLIFIVGGLTKEAYKLQAEISRISPEKVTDSTEVIFVELDDECGVGTGTTDSFLLQDHDIVFIRKDPYWDLQRNVRVEGEVVFPGIYSLETKNERLSDIIRRAGGLKETAYPEGAKFVRPKNNIGRVDVNLVETLKNPKGINDLVLEEGDYIFIPREDASVYVKGEVRFPISILFEPNKNVSHYITRAGGFTDNADRGKVKLILPNGRVTSPSRFLWFDVSKVPLGATIMVPKARETEGTDWTEVIMNVSSVVSSAVMLIFVVDRLQGD